MDSRVVKSASVIALTVGVLIAGAGPAGAGIAGTMTANPNPGFVGSSIMVSNSANSASTCEPFEGNPSQVHLTIKDPASSVVQDVLLTPDQGTGNWSSNFTPAMVGTYIATALCDIPGINTFAGNVPARVGPYNYQDLPIVVQQQVSTTASSTTSTARASTTSSISTASSGNSSNASAAVAVPKFTG